MKLKTQKGLRAIAINGLIAVTGLILVHFQLMGVLPGLLIGYALIAAIFQAFYHFYLAEDGESLQSIMDGTAQQLAKGGSESAKIFTDTE